MKFSRFPLSRLTVFVITTMLLLSVILVFVTVLWYSNYLESNIVSQLPPQALKAQQDLEKGIMPDTEGMKLLLTVLPDIATNVDLKLYMSVLLFGIVSAIICSFIGSYLARRISRPLEELTQAAEELRSGDFAVRVEVTHRSSSEVASLVETFNGLAASLQSMEKRLQFNNMAVAHELRTPLTVLRGSMQGMLDGVFPMEKATLSNLLLQVEGLTRLVEDLRTLSLAIGQNLVIHKERLDLATEVNIITEAARPMVANRGLVIETALQPAIACVDSQRIRQAILALIENACRYASSGKIVRCETAVIDTNEVAIRIIDHGPGLPDKIETVADNPFWRGDVSRSRATGGSGLGLSVVKAIATAHGGRLIFDANPTGGAVVSIILPSGNDQS